MSKKTAFVFAMILLVRVAMAEKKLEMRPTVLPGAVSSRAATAPIKATVMDFAQHRVVQCEDGTRAYVHRHDLTKPTLALISSSEVGGTFTYTYRVGNDNSARESINQIAFLASDGAITVYFSADGIAPGQEATFAVTSQYAPGQVTAQVRNLDVIKEAKFLDQLPASNPSQACVLAMQGKAPTTELSVIGPAIPPQ